MATISDLPGYVVGSVPGFANRSDYVQPYVGEQGGLLGGATASDIEQFAGGLLGDIDFGGHAALQYPEGDWYSPIVLQDYFVPFGTNTVNDTTVDDDTTITPTDDDDDEIIIIPPPDDEKREEEKKRRIDEKIMRLAGMML